MLNLTKRGQMTLQHAAGLLANISKIEKLLEEIEKEKAKNNKN